MSNLLADIRAMLEDDHVSFVQLSRIDGFRGDREMLVDADHVSNIVLWAGMSLEAVESLKQIIAEGEYEFEPATWLIYAIDGEMLSYPLAKRGRHYKKPHWLPVVIKRVKR
jgi:hypothetical protein